LNDSDARQARHPIQVVARRTGLSADVIRAWERRYHAVSPQRSATSRRLYSDQDVERLTLLRRATEAGRRISDVAGLALAELKQLVAIDAAAVAQAPVPATARTASEPAADSYLETCLTAVRNLDPVALESALTEAALALSIPALLDQVISELLNRIGAEWRAGVLRTCHEHLATAQLRSYLGHLVNAGNTTGTGPILVVAAPAGQHHELGALMVAVTAAQGGWTPLYLGPNIPSDDLAFAAAAKNARAVALSISYPADDARLPEALRRLRRQLPEQVILLAGGAALPGYRQALTEVRALQIDNLETLRGTLDELRIQ